MKTGFKILGIVLYVMLLLAFLAACGSDDETPVSTLEYTGETEPAALVTNTAAIDVISEGFVSAGAGISFAGLVPAIDFASGAEGTITGTDPSCGGGNEGSMSYDVQPNPDLTVTGTFSYSGFCTDEVNVSGTSSVVYDPISGEISMSFGGLTMTSAETNLTLDGSVSVTFDSLPPTQIDLSVDILLADNNNGGKVYWLENFGVTATNSVGSISMALNTGTFYHPDYGSVDFSTSSDIVIPSGGGAPISGVLEFLGLNSGAMYDFTAPTELKVDKDGDAGNGYEVTIPDVAF